MKNLTIIIITWIAALSIYIGSVLTKESYYDMGIIMIVAGTAWITCFLIANIK